VAVASNKSDLRLSHRHRLRERLTKAGRQAFADHEILELLLTYAIPRKDTKNIAKSLINRFGSYSAVFNQPPERLREVEGVGPQVAVFLQAVRATMARYFEEGVENAIKIASPEDVADFVRLQLGAQQRECLMVMCLNNKKRLLYHATIIEGTVDRAPFYPREIIKVALLRDATGIIMAHNHPSGDPTPSENDHCITQKLEALSREFDIKVYDHLIVTPRNAYSLKTGKLL